MRFSDQQSKNLVEFPPSPSSSSDSNFSWLGVDVVTVNSSLAGGNACCYPVMVSQEHLHKHNQNIPPPARGSLACQCKHIDVYSLALHVVAMSLA